MIPVDFEYTAPETLEQAIGALREGGEDAKVLAGGHSLIPLMKLRLAAPQLLVDIRKVPGLRGIRREDGHFRVGAMTPHATVARERGLGLAAKAAGTIADPQVRHRGTLGGTLAHGDPAADLPAIVLAMEGVMTIHGQDGGSREVAAADFFQDYLTTAVGDDEIVTEIRLPAFDGYGHAYEKFNRRAEDWAMVAVSALVKVTDGVCEDVRIGLTHMSSVPMLAEGVEQALRGQPLDSERVRRAADQAADGTDPPGDLNATPDYKRHLARVLTRRALMRAAGLAR